MVPPLSAFAARKADANVVKSSEIASDSAHSKNSKDLTDGRFDDNGADAARKPRKRKRAVKPPPSLKTAAVPADRVTSVNQQTNAEEINNDTSHAEAVTRSFESRSVTESEQDSVEPSDIESISDHELQLCNFNPSQSNISAESEDDWTVRLVGDDSIAILGYFDLWVRKGAVSLYGAILSASPDLHRVYAPSTHALPLLKPITNPYGRYDEPTEVKLISIKSRIRMLKDLSPLFGRLWRGTLNEDDASAQPTRRTFALIRTPRDDPLRRRLFSLAFSTERWLRSHDLLARNTSKKSLAILACGLKGSGKSTYCRTLTNAILSWATTPKNQDFVDHSREKLVALLDLDPGQPEFSLPGHLSLTLLRSFNFGPPFTHPVIDKDTGSQIVKLQSFGSLSPKDDPTHYLACILNLYDTYRDLLRSHRDLPLVINTSGWIQGGGLDILLHLVQALHVSDVVYLHDGSSNVPEDTPSILEKACSNTNANFFSITTPTDVITTRTPAELRTMQTLSYFHLTPPEAGNIRWSHNLLKETPPLVLHYAGPQQALLAVMILGDAQDPNLYEEILIGSLVDIVLISSPAALPSPVTETSQDENHAVDPPESHPAICRTPKSQIPYISPHPSTTRSVRPLNPTLSETLAQALIHSIDTRTKQFHLLVPPHLILPKLALLDNESLKERIILVRGRGHAPNWALEEEFVQDRARRKRRDLSENASEVDLGQAEEKENEEEALREAVGDMPWATVVVDGKGMSTGERKRRGGRR